MTGHDFAAIYGLSYIEVNRILKRMGFVLKRGNQGSNFSEADLAKIYNELEKVKKMKEQNLNVTLKGTVDKRFKGETMIDADELEEYEEEDFEDEDYFEDEEDEDSEFYDEDELGDDLDDLDDFNAEADDEEGDEEYDDEDEEIDEILDEEDEE